jgi:hypothetical protein
MDCSDHCRAPGLSREIGSIRLPGRQCAVVEPFAEPALINTLPLTNDPEARLISSGSSLLIPK